MNKYHVSLIDTDLYKLTMQMAICQMYPKIISHYQFINRDGREFPDGFGKRLQEIVDSFRGIVLLKEEKDFLREKCYYLSPVYLDFLKGYSYDPSEVKIVQEGPVLDMDIIGPAYRSVLWEVPLMATTSELYFEMTGQKPFKEDKRHTVNQMKALELAAADAYYSDFSTRRRFSHDNQSMVIADLKKYGQGHLLGTSNPHLAMEHDLISMGTIAHEWYSLHAALYGFKMANQMATEAWVNVFQGDLGTALPDTFTTDVFLKTFNTKYAKLHDGVRQDSGKPTDFIDKVVAHYNKLRVNPQFKMALFSDNLKSIDQIRDIKKHLAGRMIDRYGIGTWFSNDVGVKPLNMVIKLVACQIDGEWINTVKISDDSGKNTGDSATINLCKETLGI